MIDSELLSSRTRAFAKFFQKDIGKILNGRKTDVIGDFRDGQISGTEEPFAFLQAVGAHEKSRSSARQGFYFSEHLTSAHAQITGQLEDVIFGIGKVIGNEPTDFLNKKVFYF